MEFQKVIEGRVSIRDFSDKPLEETVIREIVKDAQRAPSWANAQATRIYIATGETLKAIKAEHAQRCDKGEEGHSDLPPLHRQDWGRGYDGIKTFLNYIEGFVADSKKEFALPQRNLFNATALAYLTLPKSAPQWGLIDLGAFGMALMLAAANRGVGSIPAYEIVKFPDEIRPRLGIADDEVIALGIGLGYVSDAKINQVRVPRFALDEILTLKK